MVTTRPPPPLTGPVTIEEFARLPDDGWQIELVRGYVVRDAPSSNRHSRIALRIGALLDDFARRNDLGAVTGADGGYVLFEDPPTVRAPDAAFVRRERLVEEPEGYLRGAPDLAVEVLSPSNTMGEIHDRVSDFLLAGTALVWVVDPESRTVLVHRRGVHPRLFSESDEIDGEDVLPGFRVGVAEFFP